MSTMQLQEENVGAKLSMATFAIKSKLSKEIYEHFETSKTCQEQVTTLWGCPGVQHTLKVKPDYKRKSCSLAKQYRLEGNTKFKKKDFPGALRRFNASVLVSPWEKKDSDEEVSLALAFANRSAALQHMKQYKKCISDIDLALEHNYPHHLVHKLYDRKGKCYANLGDKESAVNNFYLALTALEQSGVTGKDKETWDKTLKKQIEQTGKVQPEDCIQVTDDVYPLPEVQCSSPRFPCASCAFECEYSGKCGRYVTASEDVDVGEVLGVETPYASVLYPDKFGKYCYHCFKPLLTWFPCKACSTVTYCSSLCQMESWNSCHRLECSFMGWLSPEWVGRLGHLALRLTMITKLEDIVTHMSTMDNCHKDISNPYLNNYHSVFNLVTNEQHRDTESNIDLAVLSVFLLKLLDECGCFTEASEDIKMVIGGAVLHHLQICQCNGISISEMSVTPDIRHSKPSDIGIAVYPTVSLINHSCDPNMDLNFYRNTCVYRAVKDIKQGEEINLDYGPVFFIQPKKDRHETLQSQYYFTCQCDACVYDWPLWQDMDCQVPRIKCFGCQATLQWTKKDDWIKCSKCELEQNVTEDVEELGRSHQDFRDSLQQALRHDFATALPGLQAHLSRMQSLIVPPWRDFYTCQATVKQCYRLMGNTQATL